jgi:nitroimidazol reductase NimA-like FMN-containing flavoprotein (pyridoxamine 5'-phosphate oxidase superfamily)
MNDVEFLSADVCWKLLRSAPVGRLAVIVDDRPQIFPVNYVVDHATVVFRTADGTKLTASARGSAVAFEIDGYDEATRQAWSVVLKGQAAEIRGLHELLDTMHLPLAPWQSDPKHRFVRIDPDEVSGRRFAVTDPADWEHLLSQVRRTPVD